MTQLIFYDGETDHGNIDFNIRRDGPLAPQGIQFQHGVVDPEGGPNGVQNEQVIELLVLRLRDLSRRLPCRENSIAITKLEEAGMWLEKRTTNRVVQGVEATEAPHDDGGPSDGFRRAFASPTEEQEVANAADRLND